MTFFNICYLSYMPHGMNEAAITDILNKAIDNLYANQPNLYDFTSQTNQTEWNLSPQLAFEIHKFFPWFDMDIDVTKTERGNKRPDVIFHRRGTNEFNFLVIEVKFDRDVEAVEADKRKIEREWFGGQLIYQFGAVINLRENRVGCEVEVLVNLNNP